MSRPDPFEERLSCQPEKQIPVRWREEILSAARNAGRARGVARVNRAVPWWCEVFSPYPKAWAALGAAWVVILTLNLAARDTRPATLAQGRAQGGPCMEAALRQQQLIFAELAGLGDRPDANRPKAFVPRPRSPRRADIVNV